MPRLYGVVRSISPSFDSGRLRELTIKSASDSPIQFEMQMRVPVHETHYIGEVITFLPAWLDC